MWIIHLASLEHTRYPNQNSKRKGPKGHPKKQPSNIELAAMDIGHSMELFYVNLGYYWDIIIIMSQYCLIYKINHSFLCYHKKPV